MQDKSCLSRAAGLVQAYLYSSVEDHAMQDVMVHVPFARHTTAVVRITQCKMSWCTFHLQGTLLRTSCRELLSKG